MTDELLTLDYAGMTYANFTIPGLINSGVPQAAINTAKAKLRREAIKFECRRRIYSLASAEAQLNISGAATAVTAKPVADRTADDTALLEAFEASLAWIMAMRAAVEALTLDTEADFTAAASWPECPPDVLALVAQY